MLQKLSASIIRPNNADAFTARDVIGTAATHVLTLLPRGNNGVIYSARVIDSLHTATHLLELWLFGAAPAAQADNAAFSPSDTEILNLLGQYNMDTAYTTGANRILTHSANKLIVHYGTIYGCLVVAGATTPGALETFTVQLDIDQD